MPQFEHDRASVHYEIAGDGKPVLLIAGTASDSASWGPLLPLLAGRQMILIDNRGSGRTKVEGSLELSDMVGDCAALIDRLGTGPVDVIGHSLGGFLALGLAERYPDRVGKVVTLASGAISAAARVLFKDMARLYFTMAPEDWFRLLYQWLFSDPFFADESVVAGAAKSSTEYVYRQSPGDFARQVATIDRGLATDMMAIKAPVLAVSAGCDLLSPEASVRALHQGIPDVQFVTIAQAAHSIHWEKPAETAAVINDFLR